MLTLAENEEFFSVNLADQRTLEVKTDYQREYLKVLS